MVPRLAGISACVFDAYGTLFDVAGPAEQEKDRLGARWRELADLWRNRQLQYTWLRSLMGQYEDFRTVTADALDFALASLRLDDPALRQRLLDGYYRPRPHPDAAPTLVRLRQGGMRLAILSNGTPEMLSAAAGHAGLSQLLDGVLSVERLRVYKPAQVVYQLASDYFELAPPAICFVSSNAWDAHGARLFGFRVAWCNRGGQLDERLPGAPDVELGALTELPALVGLE